MLSPEYFKKKAYMIAMLLLVTVGLNAGLMALTGKNYLTVAFGSKSAILNLILFFTGVSALMIGLYRDSYLPFLGPTIMPCSLLAVSTPEGADQEVRVQAAPNRKVLYWAAEPINKDLATIPNWKEAYLQFRNAGVAVADENGIALLKLRKPQPYQVSILGLLSPHVHYRVCGDDGMLDRVETAMIDKKEYFQNVSDFVLKSDLKAKPASDTTSVPEKVVEQFKVRQEYEAVESKPFEPIQPKDAKHNIQEVAQQTASGSLMQQTFGLDESPNRNSEKLAPIDF